LKAGGGKREKSSDVEMDEDSERWFVKS